MQPLIRPFNIEPRRKFSFVLNSEHFLIFRFQTIWSSWASIHSGDFAYLVMSCFSCNPLAHMLFHVKNHIFFLLNIVRCKFKVNSECKKEITTSKITSDAYVFRVFVLFFFLFCLSIECKKIVYTEPFLFVCIYLSVYISLFFTVFSFLVFFFLFCLYLHWNGIPTTILPAIVVIVASKCILWKSKYAYSLTVLCECTHHTHTNDRREEKKVKRKIAKYLQVSQTCT